MLHASRILLAVAFLTASPAAAQNPLLQLRPAPDSVPKAPPLPDRPATISPIDIPLRAGLTIARLSEIEALIRPVRELLRVERSATLVVDSVTTLSNRQLLLPSSQVTRRALSDLNAEWERWRTQIEQWTRLVRNRTAALDSARYELREGALLWERSQQRARLEAAPAEVLTQAGEVREQIERQDAAVLRRLQQLVEVEVTLTKARLVIDAGLVAVAEAQARERQQIFRIDAPTFWAQLAGSLPSLGGTIREHWGLALSALRHFLATSQGRVAFHLLATIGLLLVILALRRGLGWPDGSEVQQITRDERWLFAHPMASSVLMGLLALAVFYPRAPSAVYDLIFLAAAIPLWRVVPSLLPPDLQRLGRRATLLFVADRLVVMLVHTTPWHRIGSLGVALFAAVLCGIAIRRFHALDPVQRRTPAARWIHRGALAGAILLGVAIVGNLAGNVTLALLLTTGVAALVYLGILFYAGANVLDGVVSLAVRVSRQDLQFVERHGAAIARRVTQVVHIAAFAGWLAVALYLFALLDPARAALGGLLGASWSLGAATFSLAGILLFFLTIWVGAVLGRWVAIILEADILDRLDLPRGVPVTIASIVRYALTTIAFFLALAAVGVDVGQLAIIGGALSVGVGFGLQTIVNNFISGLILAFERPLAVGDVVQLGELQGEVRSIGIRASVIRTFDGADVIVPNGQLISNELINWTRSDRTRRLEIPVGVAYGTDPATVITLLVEVAQSHERVRTHPKPLCLFQGFGDSSLDFVLRIWTDADDFPVVRSEVRVAVYEALRAAGIEIPFPQRDVHVRTLPSTPGAA